MTSSLFSYFGPRPVPARIGTRRGWSLIPRWRAAPLDLTGARRLEIVVAGDPKPLARMSFACPRDGFAKNSRSNGSNGLKPFNFLINLRDVLGFHDREPINEGTPDHGKDVRKYGRPEAHV